MTLFKISLRNSLRNLFEEYGAPAGLSGSAKKLLQFFETLSEDFALVQKERDLFEKVLGFIFSWWLRGSAALEAAERELRPEAGWASCLGFNCVSSLEIGRRSAGKSSDS